MIFSKLMAFAAVVAVVGQPCLGAGRYFNVSNKPFATVSNGPQNATVVDVANPRNAAQVNAAVVAAIGKSSRAASQSPVGRQIAKLRQHRLIKPNVDPKLYGTVLVRSGGAILPPGRASRAYGGNTTITFTYTGWSADDEATLKTFKTIAYPIVQTVYGTPASTITVNVLNDTAQTDKNSLLGGVYVTGAGVPPQIRLKSSASMVTLERSFLHMMIRAFHDTAAFQYDAWEDGFDRAASVIAGEAIDKQIIANPRGLQQLDYVGSGEFGRDVFYYVMPNYELLNQPALSNNTFYTAFADQLGSQIDNIGGMIIPRVGMASTAWQKVYTERFLTDGKSFFQLFNAAYYQQLAGNPGLAGNVPLLKTIASNVTPYVEGPKQAKRQTFSEWFSKQYIFDTSVSIGAKLYALVYPPSVLDPTYGDYNVPIFLINYQTTTTGEELPLSDTVYPVFWNYSYKTDIPPSSSQYETVTIANGQGDVDPGFFVDTIGGSQRVAIDFTAGTETVRVYFPAGRAGTMASPNNFLGVVVGADSGTVNVKVDNDPVGTTTTVTNGAFGVNVPSLLDFSRLTITLTPTGSAPLTPQTVIAGPGTYQTVILAAGPSAKLQNVFLPGFRMISIPMSTFAQDQSQAMANGSGNPVISADKLLLARWDPTMAGDYKYQMYPRTPPFVPGRGYWVKFPSSAIVNVTGQMPDSAAPWRIGLVSGWNQIGGPFAAPVAVANLLVEKGNDEPISFTDAWNQGLIGKVIWQYDPIAGYSAAASLAPWQGYWVKCNVADGAVLIVPGPDSKSRSKPAPPK